MNETSINNKEARMSGKGHVGGPVTIGGFAGFGFGVFWYAWGKVGFWWAVVYGIFWIPWLGYRVAELLKLGQ
jgi:hypothetical protein